MKEDHLSQHQEKKIIKPLNPVTTQGRRSSSSQHLPMKKSFENHCKEGGRQLKRKTTAKPGGFVPTQFGELLCELKEEQFHLV
jgi:hypothetical protein